MVHWEMMEQKKKTTYTILLFTPLFLSIGWLVYLRIGQAIEYTGFLSPANNRPLIIGLVIFTAGYLFFMGLMFSSNIKDWYEEWKYQREHRQT